MSFRAWELAWQEALYGADGFYRSAAGPAAHFRTSVHASPLLAGALARLARACGLGRVVDVGSGRGELLQSLWDADPGLELVGLDVVARPAGLPVAARWLVSPGGAALPARASFADALVVAHEWLDDVPCPVLQVDPAGRLRTVQVQAATGQERLGSAPSPEQLAWARRWWPVGDAEPGDRVEVGGSRDQAWAALVARAPRSVLVCVDYAHDRGSRPAAGTLVGYRAGAIVPPVADGSCDLTAHVALDAVQAAGRAAGAAASVLTTQRQALRALGVQGRAPPVWLAERDSREYLARLSEAAEATELLATGGLGSFGWLLQSRGPVLPDLR